MAALASIIDELEKLDVDENGKLTNASAEFLEVATAKLHDDPYLCLNLPNTASHAEVTAAFRMGARKFHPDKNKSPAAAAIFREVKYAQELLGDEESRKEYDEKKRREKVRTVFVVSIRTMLITAVAFLQFGKINVGPSSRRRSRARPPPQPAHIVHEGKDLPSFRNDGRNKNVTSVSFNAGVSRIGKNGFMYAENLVRVIIPDGVTVLGEQAFKGCCNLRSVSLPEGLREIGGYTFNGCASLNEVRLPSTVESLGSYCFSYCKELQRLNIPEGVKKLGTGPFTYCAKLVPHGLISTNDTDAVVRYLREKEAGEENKDSNTQGGTNYLS